MSKRQGGKVKPLKQAKKATEDKTFGMKNKKGKAAQKVAQTYQNAGKSKEDKMKEMEKEAKKLAKAEKEREEKERQILFKAVDKKPKQLPQTVPPGVDPKSVLCINFKNGHCANGEKCIFSHDLAVERKGEKRDAYDRDDNDTIDNWDDTTLAEAVNKKFGKPGNPTAGICKHFIKALEERKFGWFWECPSGAKCQFRHALPPGFKLETKKAKDDKVVERPIEDILEEKRAALPTTGGTPVNAQTFQVWKNKILKAREAEEKKNKKDRAAALESGRARKTGRELLQESDYKEEFDEGEDMDILSFLKQRAVEEEALDKENAEIVQKLSAEAAESERAFDRRVAELEAEGLSAAEAIAKLSLNDNPDTPDDIIISPRVVHTREYDEENGEDEGDDKGDENVLEGVDTDLFEAEAEQEEDLPEFSDEE